MYRLSEVIFNLSARSFIWLKDSSAEVYKTFFPELVNVPLVCSNNVDLPIPGSPANNMTEPCTIPPPRTLSNSDIVVAKRVSWFVVISLILTGQESVIIAEIFFLKI